MVSRFLKMLITISYIHFQGSFYDAMTVKMGSSVAHPEASGTGSSDPHSVPPLTEAKMAFSAMDGDVGSH